MPNKQKEYNNTRTFCVIVWVSFSTSLFLVFLSGQHLYVLCVFIEKRWSEARISGPSHLIYFNIQDFHIHSLSFVIYKYTVYHVVSDMVVFIVLISLDWWVVIRLRFRFKTNFLHSRKYYCLVLLPVNISAIE